MRSSLRAVRLPADPDARLRGHRALRAHVGRGLGRRAQGDVHVRGPGRPLAHAAARGHRADRPRLRRARAAPGAAAGQAYTIATDVPLRRAADAAATASTGSSSLEAIGSRRPGDRRGGDPVLRGAAPPARRHRVGARLNSIGDAKCRPAYVARLNEWLDAHPEPSTRTRGTSARRAPCRSSTSRTSSVRAALADAPKIGDSLCDACREHFDAVRAPPRRVRRPRTSSIRRSCAASTTTRARRSSSSGPRRTSTRRSAAAAATTGWSRRSAAPATPGDRLRRRDRAAAARDRARGTRRRRRRRLDVFFVARGARRGRCSPQIAELRADGIAADTDYAGRSMKGQLTQAQRLGAETVVVARGDGTYECGGAGRGRRVVTGLAEI